MERYNDRKIDYRWKNIELSLSNFELSSDDGFKCLQVALTIGRYRLRVWGEYDRNRYWVSVSSEVSVRENPWSVLCLSAWLSRFGLGLDAEIFDGEVEGTSLPPEENIVEDES